MNRVKVWVFTLLVAAFGLLAARAATLARRTEGIAAVDARLASAAAYLATSTRSLAREATAVATLAARDPKLVAALDARDPGAKAKKIAPVQQDPEATEAKLGEAAREALASAERQLGYELAGATVSAGDRESLARKGEPGAAESDATALLRAAIAGEARRAFLRLDGALWFGAGAPVGEGAGVILLVPLDERWARGVAAGAGADVTLSAPEVKPVSTARRADVAQLERATRLAGPVDVGSPGKVDVSVGPLRLPRLPQPFDGGAPIRARAIPIEGVTSAFAIVSATNAAPELAAAFFWRAVAGLALVLVTGVLLGFLVAAREGSPEVPEELRAAAARIEQGDFAARARPSDEPVARVTPAPDEWYLGSARSPPLDTAHAIPPTMTIPATLAAPLAIAPEPFPPPVAAVAAEPSPTPASELAATASSTPAPLELDEEAHWRQVFQDFLRTRASCGEVAEGLAYERFRQKLDTNKAQLVAKYGCRTVRFQVYVKNGKAALKATPVR